MENNKLLFQAIENGDIKKVEQLIKEGADVNARYTKEKKFLGRHEGNAGITVGMAFGDRPPTTTPMLRYFEVVKNSTPLMWAVRYGHNKNFVERHGHYNITKLLLDKGADVNAKASDNITPLILLCLDANAKIVKLLLDNGADVNAKATMGNALKLANYCDIQSTEAYLEDGVTTSFDLLKQAGAEEKSCFVATVVYESGDCWELEQLRKWRDSTLKKYLMGKIYIYFYYKFGYSLSKLIKANKLLKKLTKNVIDKLIHKVIVLDKQ